MVANNKISTSENIKFVGHVVGKTRAKPNLNKVKAVVEFAIVHTITNVQAFIGLTNYSMNYIKRCVWITIPLFDLTKCDVTFQWTLDGQKAFRSTEISTCFCTNTSNTRFLQRIHFGHILVHKRRWGYILVPKRGGKGNV